MEKERKRSANLTQRKKELLITLVEKYRNIIENKKTNAVFNKQKSECWEKLAWEFNANQTTGMRTGVQLKSTYEQLKKIAKQHKYEDKVEILKTGGGLFIPKITNTDEKVLSLLKNNYFWIDNPYDSNADLQCNTTNNLSFNNSYTNQSLGPSTSKSNAQHTITSHGASISNSNSFANAENIVFVNEEEEDFPENSKTNIPANLSLQDFCNKQPEPESKFQVKAKEKTQEVEEETERNKPKKKTLKRKLQSNKRQEVNSNKENIADKKMEIVNLKISKLKKIEESELENLKGKKLDNEIKEIIKEKELLELKLK